MTWAALASGAAFMDAPALRATLDAIHASLASPPLVMQPSHSHGAERERITSALRGVVSVLQAIDLEAHRALTGHVSVYRSTKDSDALRTFVTALGDALARRVLGGLGERTLRVLCELLDSDVPDLLGILGRGADENAHSDILRWLLHPRTAPTVAPAALAILADRLDCATDWRRAFEDAIQSDTLCVRRELVYGREWATESRDRVDVVISGPGFLLAIENKIWASEHGGQTAAYAEWLRTLSGLRAGIFLSPSGMQALDAEFRPMSYLELLGALLEGPCDRDLGHGVSVLIGQRAGDLEKAREIFTAETRAFVTGILAGERPRPLGSVDHPARDRDRGDAMRAVIR